MNRWLALAVAFLLASVPISAVVSFIGFTSYVTLLAFTLSMCAPVFLAALIIALIFERWRR